MKINFFQESDGSFSSMRLFCFMALCIAIVITGYDLIKNVNHFEYIIAFLSAAFGGKSIQRFAEQKNIDVVEKEIK